ncbi:MAG: MogA/MoaB family molybdenum cofactor biosynthesis protein [Chloroflexi bacterium]|nr:MogA/MoaB family molybdenum cofactor biosynthesis protein [Chloroflexota bacterium]
MFTFAVLTVSDAASRGERVDLSGQAIREIMEVHGYRLSGQAVVPDEEGAITERLKGWATSVDLILTTGGTGLAPRDVTPEATQKVIERPVPGLAEAMRLETARRTPTAILSRGIAGMRGRCLIVNLPGSPRAVRECLEVVLPVLDHALEILSGTATGHPVPPARGG